MTKYFTRGELALWLGSAAVTVVSFLIQGGSGVFSLITSLIGVTSLIFVAKGNPIGQALGIVFALFYGAISYTFAYYGEMITYLCMTMPMAVFSLISWLRHPYKGSHAEVEVGSISKREHVFMWILAAAVTFVFYFVLKYFRTANLVPSTVSVTTSFLAVYLSFRRSPYYAVAYAANDIVLIVLWVMAAMENASYFSVVMCFAAFLANDIYGYVNWSRMADKQSRN